LLFTLDILVVFMLRIVMSLHLMYSDCVIRIEWLDRIVFPVLCHVNHKHYS